MLINSGSVSQTLNCRAALSALVKRAIKNNKKIEQEKQGPILNRVTHITLLWRFGVVPGDPQKTPVLGPRHISSGLWKALMCNWRSYGSNLLTSYINNLSSRHPFPFFSTRER
jgi:hypothetical protein